LPDGERRLAAIMFTDMVGYTALTQSNESQAMEVLERHNRLLRPFFPKYHGREVKAIGDSFLVEFESALDAIRCAVEIQSYLHDYNISSKDEWKIKLRIGIHLGDVIHQAGDVFGDAVNIASRIQAVAEPEGVCISEQVYDQVRNKSPQSLVKLAPKDLKNVQFHIDVYKVAMPWEGELTASSMKLDTRRIAVLPFANISPDPGDEYFADGMTEELITSLSGVKELTVIARTSVMKYKTGTKGVDEIGRELNVGTLVEGSVRKAGHRIRVAVQLVNSNTGGHLWAQNYDRELEDVFAIQSDIAERVAKALEVKVLGEERSRLEGRASKNTEALTLYMKGRASINEGTEPSVRRAIEYLERAVQQDSDFALAYVGLADCYYILTGGWHMSWSEGLAKAKENLDKAMALNPQLGEAHALLGLWLRNELRWKEAEAEFKIALQLSPSYALAHNRYAALLYSVRRLDEALYEARKAEELDPLSLSFMGRVAWVLYYRREFEQAIEQCNRILRMEPTHDDALITTFLAYVHKSALNQAETCFSKLREVLGGLHGTKAWLGAFLAAIGRTDEAKAMIKEAERDPESSPVAFAYYHTFLGNVDLAFDFLDKACEARDAYLYDIKVDPSWDRLRSDTRFAVLLQKLHLS
jgi:adenylate cyclase